VGITLENSKKPVKLGKKGPPGLSSGGPEMQSPLRDRQKGTG